MQIVRLGLENGEAVTGRSKEELLQKIYRDILARRRELDEDALSVVDGEGRGLIVGSHSFTSAAATPGAEVTTVTIGETLPNDEYGVLLTRNMAAPNSGWNIENKTTKTFDVRFDTLADSTAFSFSWMIIY